MRGEVRGGVRGGVRRSYLIEVRSGRGERGAV